MELSFHSNAQSEAVMSAHGEISQKSLPKKKDVRDVSTPILL